jgi:AcrR family transcriptional regulator
MFVCIVYTVLPSVKEHLVSDAGPEEGREAAAARKEAGALRRDREKADRAAEKERVRATRDREKADRDRAKAAQAADREAARRRAEEERSARDAERDATRRLTERERSVREAEKEAAQAQRAAEKAALDAAVAAQRAARQVEKARLRAETAGLVPEPSSDLPPGLAVLWRSPEPGRRGPRPGLTVDRITAAGVRLADAEGLPAVSMARVAESLGVTTMALYRYLAGKEELLALMCDAVIDEVSEAPVPTWAAGAAGAADDGAAWRDRVEAWCRRQYAVIERHPWLMQAVGAMPVLGPRQVAMLELGLTALRGTPLSVELRVAVIGALSLHVLSEGRVIAEAATMARRAAAADAVADAAAEVGVQPAHPALLDYATLLGRLTDPSAHPEITAALAVGAFGTPADAAPADADEAYDVAFGLTLMLDGLQALIDRVSAGGPTVRGTPGDVPGSPGEPAEDR